MGEAKARARRGEKPATIGELRITLLGVDPPVWRRVRVDGETTLAELHDVIQAVMPWEDGHLHQFDVDDAVYGPALSDGFAPLFGPPPKREDTARLRRLLSRPGDVLYYQYDFGDSWQHEVRLERWLQPVEGERYPVCVAGERACPPEDCGGVPGYAWWLEALADPGHEDHEDAVSWFGEGWDPEAVDLAAANRRLARRGGGVTGGNGPAPPGVVDHEAPDDDPGLAELRATARAVIEDALRADPDMSLDELNARLAERITALNRTPRSNLLGSTPDQVQRLLADDWSGDDAIRMDTGLPAAALETAPFFRNARSFLALLDEHDGFKATQAGNLSRAAVATLLDGLDWPDGHVERVRRYNKVINEHDAGDVHHLRVLLDLAGLIKRRKGRFTITRRGADALSPHRAGELFALLFRTWFRKLNLAYLDAMPEAPAFQNTVAFTLFRLGQVAGDWRESAGLARDVVLPTILDEIPRALDSDDGFDRLPVMLETRVLDPLAGFGLAEVREEPGRTKWLPRRFYRKTDLFDRFLAFRLDG